MNELVVEPILESCRVLRAVAFDVCDATRAKVSFTSAYTHITRECAGETNRSPFALPVHLVLRESDILVVKVDPQVLRHLPQVLISRPL